MSGRRMFRRLLTGLALFSGAEVGFQQWNAGTVSGSRVLLATSGANRFFRSSVVALQVSREYRNLFRDFEGEGYRTPSYKDARSAVHAQAAVRIVKLCREQGGIYLKIGQHAASLTHALPEEFTTRLIVLQDDCPYDPIEDVEHIWRTEFPSSTLEDVFEYFDPVPVASASLAQVHRARTRAGEEVAVKIQHPGLQFRVAVDLATLRLLSVLAKWRFEDFDIGFVVPEIEKNLSEELDFRREALNATAMKETTKVCKRVLVPKIHSALSSRRVLGMDYIHGCRVSDVDVIAKAGIDPSKVAKTVAEVFSQMTFISGFMHCDPHSGNLLVRFLDELGKPMHIDSDVCTNRRASDYEVVVIDHGLCRQIDPSVREQYCRLWKGLVLRDRDCVEQASELLGITEGLELWSLFLMNRSWSSVQRQSNSELTARSSRDEMRRISRSLKNQGLTRVEFFQFLSDVPRDLLLVFKVNSLARNIIQSLAGQNDGKTSINRFTTGARYAVYGLHNGSRVSSDEWESYVSAPKGCKSVAKEAPAQRLSWLAWLDIVKFEIKLASISIVVLTRQIAQRIFARDLS